MIHIKSQVEISECQRKLRCSRTTAISMYSCWRCPCQNDMEINLRKDYWLIYLGKVNCRLYARSRRDTSFQSAVTYDHI